MAWRWSSIRTSRRPSDGHADAHRIAGPNHTTPIHTGLQVLTGQCAGLRRRAVTQQPPGCPCPGANAGFFFNSIQFKNLITFPAERGRRRPLFCRCQTQRHLTSRP
eukprot:89514-Chlamydomonas_euryale.AAC.1